MHRFSAVPQPDETTPSPAADQALAIKRWTREILNLDAEATLTVSELACSDPGCPLVETTLAVFEEGRTRIWKFTRPRIAVTKLMVQQTLQTPATS